MIPVNCFKIIQEGKEEVRVQMEQTGQQQLLKLSNK